MLTDSQFEKRMAICRECPHITKGEGCGRLGIYLPTNARMEDMPCPEHRHPKILKESDDVEFNERLDAPPTAAEAATDFPVLDGEADEAD